VFYRVRVWVWVGCIALEQGIRAYHDRVRIERFPTYPGKVELLSTRGLFESQLEVRSISKLKPRFLCMEIAEEV
jgi:hypothetical protein